MQTSVSKIIYQTKKCTYRNVEKYMKTKVYSEYVWMNYMV